MAIFPGKKGSATRCDIKSCGFFFVWAKWGFQNNTAIIFHGKKGISSYQRVLTVF